MKTYHVIEKLESGNEASAHIEARSKAEAARKCHKTAKDIKSGRVRVVLVGEGCRWQQETGYAVLD